jgi:hypothetical protein
MIKNLFGDEGWEIQCQGAGICQGLSDCVITWQMSQDKMAQRERNSV